MTDEQFTNLVNKLEIFARQKPDLYKFYVGALAILGYAYIFGIVSLLLGLIILLGYGIFYLVFYARVNGYLVGKVLGGAIAIPAVILWVALKSLFVRFAPPQGLEVTRQQVPKLFNLIDELKSSLKSAPFHRVLMVGDFNAMVVQRPRLGIFGWQQNYLIIGLPLMQSLTPMQFKAVLAHEFGHLSGNHSKFAAWVYRIRKTWWQLMETLAQSVDRSSGFIFEVFFNWYAPFFNAYSFVLARMDEYEADKCAVNLAGADNVARALIYTELKAKFLERNFWDKLYKQVNDLIEPPANCFTQVAFALSEDIPRQNYLEWLDQSLQQKTNTADTHPCLTDRLNAIGYKFNADEFKLITPKVNAADAYLKDKLPSIIEHFNDNWQLEMSTNWRQRYAYIQEGKTQLASLNEQAKIRDLTADECYNRDYWVAEILGEEVAFSYLEVDVKKYPDHSNLNYAFGYILIQRNNAEGIAYLQVAMDQDWQKIISCCQLIYYFLMGEGKKDEAKVYQEKITQQEQKLMLAQQERNYISDKDTFTEHNLDHENLDNLCQQLQKYAIKRAHLVQKVLQYFPENPCYVLLVQRKLKFIEGDRNTEDQNLLNQLTQTIQFPYYLYIIIDNDSSFNGCSNKIRQVNNSQIYQQQK